LPWRSSRRNGAWASAGSSVDALEAQARSEGIEQIYSVLLAEDERDSTFLEKSGFSASELKIYAKRL